MIRRDRARVNQPQSIDPACVDVQNENAANEAVVLAQDAIGAPWKTWCTTLVFNVYSKNEDVKHALSVLFDNKCAFCETSLDGQDMHTEHFRPKKQVDIEDDPSQRGYWWLGAAWKNLLPACGHCNRSPGVDHPTGLSYGSGKGNRFPLLPGSPRANGPGQENAELPVLIDPSYEEPSHYFTFRVLDDLSFATIKHLKTTAEQFRATGTMEILGINRDGLVRMRTAHLKSVKYAVRGYIKAAKVLNQAIAGNAPQPVIDQCQTDVQQEWDELYDTYLNPSRQYLHATVRLVESELCSAGLKLSSLLQGRDLHLPAASLV